MQLTSLGATIRRKYLDSDALLDPEHPDMNDYVRVCLRCCPFAVVLKQLAGQRALRSA